MKVEDSTLGEIKIVGLKIRTNNDHELNTTESKIAAVVNKYWSGEVSENILYRTDPGTTFGVYAEFESDEHGNYSYFIGEQVSSFDSQDFDMFSGFTIPPQSYKKFTTAPGDIPHVVINAWQEIWEMRTVKLGGKRNYIADFEIFDSRASNPKKAIVDIFIGIGGSNDDLQI